MSLLGRRIIDRIKSSVSHRFTLPCPPYEKPEFWKKVYKKLSPEDVFEWGDISFNDVSCFNYNPHKYVSFVRDLGYHHHPHGHDPSKFSDSDGEESPITTYTTTLSDAIGTGTATPPRNSIGNDNAHAHNKIMLLGCGNSRLGEDMIADASFANRTHILQVDFCEKVLHDMNLRCSTLVSSGVMDFVHDDATELNAFEDDSITAVIDKGLVDALFCTDGYDSMRRVMKSVNRVLAPGGTFLVFSFSRPEFMLNRMVEDTRVLRKRMWGEVDIWELENILMYRYRKSGREKALREKMSRLHQRNHWRRRALQ